jgi:hypothetical protein
MRGGAEASDLAALYAGVFSCWRVRMASAKRRKR